MNHNSSSCSVVVKSRHPQAGEVQATCLPHPVSHSSQTRVEGGNLWNEHSPSINSLALLRAYNKRRNDRALFTQVRDFSAMTMLPRIAFKSWAVPFEEIERELANSAGAVGKRHSYFIPDAGSLSKTSRCATGKPERESSQLS